MMTNNPEQDTLRERLHEIIFEADTPVGKFFDILLLVFILLSIVVVMLESVDQYAEAYGTAFVIIEWILTIFFTIEYLLRLYAVLRPIKYATSFFGVIDLLSILPAYLSLFALGSQSLLTIRALRLLRVFRIFKLGHYMNEGAVIMSALRASYNKILVFLFFILVIVTIIGSVMYLLEGEKNPAFTSIPRSIYWAIVTLTTVGYGDITPQTNIGQFLSAAVMILGYAVIAVPTGIVTNELMQGQENPVNTQACRYCGKEGHSDDAVYCKYCGQMLERDDRYADGEDEHII